MKRLINFVTGNNPNREFAFLSLLLTFFMGSAQAQVGVGTNSPHPTAQLDVHSTSKGFLTPRLTEAQRLSITSPAPADGLLVYQIDGTKGFYYYDGGWKLIQTLPPHPPVDPVGFIARRDKTAPSISTSSKIDNFTPYTGKTLPPYFNTTTGVFTAPESGVYYVSAVVNYTTTAAITVNLGQGIDPRIALRVNGAEDKLKGVFPVLNVNILLLLTLRAVLGSGSVVVSGTVELEAGDTVELFYEASGLGVSLNLGAGQENGVTWSMRKL